MILYYVRHGDPVYNPNELTPLGERQAEAVAKRLAVYGIDKIYTSPSNRAWQTVQPLCQITKRESVTLDWADEELVAQELIRYEDNGKRNWIFRTRAGRSQLSKNEVRDLGRQWYTHPDFADTNCASGMKRIQKEVDAFLASHGYRHDLENNCYYEERDNEERIALFAHEGVGMAILSCMLDIPYPIFSTHFDMTHTGVSVIHFAQRDGIVIPKLLSFSNDSHLYREGLPTKHQNEIYY